MGNCDKHIPSIPNTTNTLINLSHFKFIHPIGRGGFSQVFKVKFKHKRLFALKQISKAKAFKKDSLESIAREVAFLKVLYHPFIANMYYAFQNENYLYIALDYFKGGDLRDFLYKAKKLTQEETKFVVSNLLLAIQYIHSNKIIHRDLKPENICLDMNGFVHITDFGISFKLGEGNCNEQGLCINISGTPGYMAPEVYSRKGHGYAADFFSLGIITFELIYGRRPYEGKTKREIQESMTTKEIKLIETPNGYDDEVIDFVNRLVKRKPKDRLGYHDISEIFDHPFLKDVHWKKISQFEEKSPLKDKIAPRGNYNKSYVNAPGDFELTEGEIKKCLKIVNESKIFSDYYYNYEEEREMSSHRSVLFFKNELTRRQSRKSNVSTRSVTPIEFEESSHRKTTRIRVKKKIV